MAGEPGFDPPKSGGGVLCLCGGVNQKRAIIAKLLQPAGHIGALILWDSG
jgi:hypothetical protein